MRPFSFHGPLAPVEGNIGQKQMTARKHESDSMRKTIGVTFILLWARGGAINGIFVLK
jgi:hypothetical protein